MKLAMFLPATENSWLSCRQILKSLVGLYEVLPNVQVYRYQLDGKAEVADMDVLAAKVVNENYDALVFPSHSPHPYFFLTRWQRLKKPTKIIFHAYGDFAIDSRQWLRLNQVLQECDVTFFAASNRQKNFLSSLVNDPSNVSLLPFLPDTNYFKFQEKKGLELRKKLSVKDDEWIFFYSGRLSRQKHILELTSMFDRFVTQVYPNAQLWLAGEFDDLGMPYIGKTELNFEHYQHWLALVGESKAASKIRYLGRLETEELAHYANAADWGIFPSTHNDEDFGLAPLELLMSGTPCILSDWGGYADFVNDGDTKVIPVSMKSFMLTPDMNRLTKELFALTAMSQRPSASERLERSQRYHEKFSEKRLSQLLAEGLKRASKFQGYSDNMNRLSDAFERNSYAPFVDVESFGGYNKEFEELYASYFGRS